MPILNKVVRYNAVIIFAGLLNACVYRFTNLAIQPPKDTRSICVESIYDTTNEVIPNELLWRAIQNEIVRNGRLILQGCDRSDALMQVTISLASVAPVGTPQTVDRTQKDPSLEDRQRRSPDDYHNLRTAGTYTSNEEIRFTVQVKVFHLVKQKLIFEQSYQRAGQFRSVTDSKLAQRASGFLLYQEGLEARFKELSHSLARRITTDFLLNNKG